MRVIGLRVDNFQRLSAVIVKLAEGSITTVGGANAQGKSSLLDALEAAIGGKKHTGKMPVRKGQPRAKVEVLLGDDPEFQDIKVTRTFTPDGGGTIVIEARDGSRFASPQAMLDKLLGRGKELSFDPVAFEDMKDEDQAELLRQIVGLDTSDLDAEHEKTYNLRTERNRVVKQLEGQLAALMPHPGVPAKEVSIAELTQQLEAANKTKADFDAGRQTYQDAVRAQQQAHDAAALTEQEIETLRLALAKAEEKLVAQRADLLSKSEAVETAKAAGFKLRDTLIDPQPILDQMRDAEAINAKVRENKQRDEVEAQVAQEREAAQTLTDKLTAIETEREARIAAATFPVPGLSVEGTSVMFNGVPFSQASQAERLRVAASIGFALSGKLKLLLVRDASRLDSNGLRMLAAVAEEVDGHVIAERVAERDEDGKYPKGLTVVIEDGAVVDQAVSA